MFSQTLWYIWINWCAAAVSIMASHSKPSKRISHQIFTCCGSSHACMPAPAKLVYDPTSNGHWCVMPDHADLKFLVYTLYSDLNTRPEFRVLIFISLWIIATIKTVPLLLLLNAVWVVSMQKLWLRSRRHALIMGITAAERPRCDIPKYVRIVRKYVSFTISADCLREMRFRGIITFWKKSAITFAQDGTFSLDQYMYINWLL